MQKAQISTVLNDIGLLLELLGENPFKSRAYYQAARIIESMTEDLEELVRRGKLGEVPGIGPALREKITTLVNTGRLPYYDDLRSRVPAGLLEMLRVPGLGPRKVQTLYKQLAITTPHELEEACRQGRLRDLPGFGLKTELKILAGLEWMAKHRGLHLWVAARMEAIELERALAAIDGVVEVSVAGSLRRGKELVKDIDLVAAVIDAPKAVEAFVRLSGIDRVNAKGGTKVAVTLAAGMDVDLRLVTPAEFASALLYLTGSKEHNTALRGLAKDRGLKLNEYGLFRGGERLESSSEAEIYEALGLDFIPPELREDLGEIEAAADGSLPVLVESGDVRGALHVHTNASDGTASLEEMAAAAAGLGWEYMGIADHSQSAVYAGGLPPERVMAQWEAIDAHNRAGRRPYLLAGIESEIKADGSLDYSEDILARFDYVIGSIHSGFNLDQEAMTARVIKAMQHPRLTVLGHPTGRLLLEREGFAIDLDAVLNAAAAHGVALEINASPHRLDLDWRWCHKARGRGIVFWVNPDAHSLGELSLVPLGINVARKGWLTAAEVANTWPLDRVREWMERKKTAAGRVL